MTISNPSDAPVITGPNSGKPETFYEFGFTSSDPNGDDIAEYIVKWGDDSGKEKSIGPFASGEEGKASHSGDDKRTYTIQAKAKDIYGTESIRGFLIVNIPRNKASLSSLLLWITGRFPMLERLLSFIIVM